MEDKGNEVRKNILKHGNISVLKCLTHYHVVDTLFKVIYIWSFLHFSNSQNFENRRKCTEINTESQENKETTRNGEYYRLNQTESPFVAGGVG